MAKPKSQDAPGSGDVEITLGSTKLTLRSTMSAALMISRQTGGIRVAMDKVISMDLDVIMTVIRAGIGADEVKRIKNLDELVFENGLLDSQGEVLGRCTEFLFNLSRGGKPAPKDGGDKEDSDEDPPSQ